MPALAFVFLCSVFKEHCPGTRSQDRRCPAFATSVSLDRVGNESKTRCPNGAAVSSSIAAGFEAASHFTPLFGSCQMTWIRISGVQCSGCHCSRFRDGCGKTKRQRFSIAREMPIRGVAIGEGPASELSSPSRSLSGLVAAQRSVPS